MPLRVSVFGLGYVGCVSVACLARDGHLVFGVDVNSTKVDTLSGGLSPIDEPGLAKLLAHAVSAGTLQATTDVAEAVRQTDVAIICVGTPSTETGASDLQFIERVSRQIGQALRTRNHPFTVLVRSTVLPGTTEGVVRALVQSNAGADVDVRFGFHPEFMREATAITDYDEPARVVVGCDRVETAEIVEALYPRLTVPIARVGFRTAEVIKYADNSFHALKVAFANEIGSICGANGVNGRELMALFVQDRKLNISPVYLRPGAPFGGSCLPKDLRALLAHAADLRIDAVILRAVLESNEVHKRRILAAVQKAGGRKIAVLGLSFKNSTDDLRESPAVELVEALVGKGYEVRIFDPDVRQPALLGANLSYIQRELPHLEQLLKDSVKETVAGANVVVVTKANPLFEAVAAELEADQVLFDTAGTINSPERLRCRYGNLSG